MRAASGGAAACGQAPAPTHAPAAPLSLLASSCHATPLPPQRSSLWRRWWTLSSQRPAETPSLGAGACVMAWACVCDCVCARARACLCLPCLCEHVCYRARRGLQPSGTSPHLASWAPPCPLPASHAWDVGTCARAHALDGCVRVPPGPMVTLGGVRGPTNPAFCCLAPPLQCHGRAIRHHPDPRRQRWGAAPYFVSCLRGV
jgi:hypothetical protein